MASSLYLMPVLVGGAPCERIFAIGKHATPQVLTDNRLRMCSTVSMSEKRPCRLSPQCLVPSGDSLDILSNPIGNRIALPRASHGWPQLRPNLPFDWLLAQPHKRDYCLNSTIGNVVAI